MDEQINDQRKSENMFEYRFNPTTIPDLEPMADEELKDIDMNQHMAPQKESDQFETTRQEILSGKRRGHVLARPQYQAILK